MAQKPEQYKVLLLRCGITYEKNFTKKKYFQNLFVKFVMFVYIDHAYTFVLIGDYVTYVYRHDIKLNKLDYSYKRYITTCVLAKTDGWFDKDDANNNEWQFGTWGWSHVDSVPLSRLIYLRSTNANGGNVNKEIIEQLCIHNKHVINKIWQWKRQYSVQLRHFNDLMQLKVWTIAPPWMQLADMEIKKNESRIIAQVTFKIDPNEPFKPINGIYSCRDCGTKNKCKCIQYNNNQ